MDPPSKEALADALRQLQLLGAVTKDTNELTEHGKLMSAFPLSPMLSQCIISANQLGCLGSYYTFMFCIIRFELHHFSQFKSTYPKRLCLASLWKSANLIFGFARSPSSFCFAFLLLRKMLYLVYYILCE